MRRITFISIVVCLLFALAGFVFRVPLRERIESMFRPALPPAEMYEDIRQISSDDLADKDAVQESSNGETTDEESESFGANADESTDDSVADQAVPLPKEKRLAVPFMVQAPHANWDMPYQEACEEASLAMVAGYYRGERDAYSAEDADRMILDLVSFEEGVMKYGPDMTAHEAAKTAEAYYTDLSAKVLPLASVEGVKGIIADGIPVVLPADGKCLPNPNFRNGGPVYHMLVVVGYTDGAFVTNDPGTRKGESFLYAQDELLSCVHDWNGGDVSNGDRVMIILQKKDD